MTFWNRNLFTDFMNGTNFQPQAQIGPGQTRYGPIAGQTPNLSPFPVPSDSVSTSGPDGKINGAKAVIPTYESLKFDPDGPGHWGVAIQHPFDARTASELADEAIAATKKEYPGDAGGLENDEADAFRHAYWSLKMSQAFGQDIAKKFSDAHEISVPNPDTERLMDLYNNQIGRGLSVGGAKGKEIEIIKKAIHDNMLRTRKF